MSDYKMSMDSEVFGKLMAVIGDEDTCVGFLLGGIGEVKQDREANFMVVERDTTAAQIETCFKNFLQRPDIAIILINQMYADMIRPTVDAHVLPVPTVVEIPSKQQPYDASKDSILKRAHVSYPEFVKLLHLLLSLERQQGIFKIPEKRR
ncbi:hypothetical protein KR026_003913 [Drosophila bipectinata]|nr:hypothetical protein KR026_003913 [Drosophila bipectinata]